jgi:hypothetical protein
LRRQFASTDAVLLTSQRCTCPDLASRMFELSTTPRPSLNSALPFSEQKSASLWTHHADDIEPDGLSCNRPFRDLSNEFFKINIVTHACLPHAANKEGIMSFNIATAQSSRGADVSVARHLVAPPKLNASCMRRERRSRSRLEFTDIKRSCLSPH